MLLIKAGGETGGGLDDVLDDGVMGDVLMREMKYRRFWLMFRVLCWLQTYLLCPYQ